MSGINICYLAILYTIVLSLVLAETIHFTNSPRHQIHQINDNFTSYKLLVPGSEPITIIESKVIQHNNRHHQQQQLKQQQHHHNIVSQDQYQEKRPLTRKSDQHTYYSDSENITNNSNYNNNNNNDNNINNNKETTASSLAKVIQRRNGERYSEKELVSRSSSLLHRVNNRNQDVRVSPLGLQISGTTELATATSEKSKVIDEDMIDGDAFDDQNGSKKIVYSPMLLQKFIQDYTDKIKNADQSTNNALKEIERINSPEETTTDRLEFDDQLEQKYSNWDDRSYNSGSSSSSSNNRPHQNPFNDKNGWVTLDAVPWSTSKVSKWHPNTDKYNQFDDDQQHSSQYPPPSWNNDDNDDHNIDNVHNYYQSKPRPPYYENIQDDEYADTNRPFASSKPAIYTSYDPYRLPNDRPSYTKPMQVSYNEQMEGGYHQTQKPFSSRPRPTQYDYNSHTPSTSSNSKPNYYPQQDKDKWYDHHSSATSKPWSEDIIADTRPSGFPKQPVYKRPSTRPPSSHAQDRYEYHPYSHPDNGNGEWVLVSTTKGYQVPTRHGQRAMSMHQPSRNDIMSHHSVKLTVLPPLNDTFSHDQPKKTMALSHGGLLEVESSFDTVDDSVASAFSSTKKNNTASKIGNKKRRIYKGVPLKSRITGGQDPSALLAAVGAGMVPATVAMLMPMVLGRKRRSLNETETSSNIVFNRNQ